MSDVPPLLGAHPQGPAIGLRTLHDALPVVDCPFAWSTASRVELARDRLESGTAAVSNLSPSLGLIDSAMVTALLDDPPGPDSVVCHGNACAPKGESHEAPGPTGEVPAGSPPPDRLTAPAVESLLKSAALDVGDDGIREHRSKAPVHDCDRAVETPLHHQAVPDMCVGDDHFGPDPLLCADFSAPDGDQFRVVAGDAISGIETSKSGG